MDMEQETTLWTATQTNNFVFKQLKACLMPHEFIVCPTIPHSLDIHPPRRRRLIRVHDHHVILEILRKKEDGWEKKIQEKLCCLEKDALEKAWGITVDENGNTVKKRK